MSMSHSEAVRPGATSSAMPHLHLAGETCPTCDQPIPHDRFDEIKERIEARQSARETQITTRLTEEFGRQKAEAVEQVRQEAAVIAATQVASARQEERQAAEAAANQKLVEAERVNKDALAAMKVRIEQAEAARSDAQAQIDQVRRDSAETIQNMKQDADARVNAARQDATTAAEIAMQEKVTGAEQAKAEVEAKLLAAEEQNRQLRENYNTQLGQRLQEQREALTKDKDKAILETEARTFAERQRLQASVQDLTRQLEKVTAHERGEGAEINLFEALKGAFEGDRVRRVKPGVAGPDIIHEIVRHGKVCGTIIYETKNRNDYKSAYATKLRADQMAAKAEFAVLSSNHFPGKARQLHLHEGVIVACPARVVTLAQMLRRHLLQLHELRISIEERGAKTEKLYKFITSDQCRQLLDSVEKLVDDMLELDVKEQNAHKAIWEKRGRMLNLVLKAHGDFCCAVDRIIGTAD